MFENFVAPTKKRTKTILVTDMFKMLVLSKFGFEIYHPEVPPLSYAIEMQYHLTWWHLKESDSKYHEWPK